MFEMELGENRTCDGVTRRDFLSVTRRILLMCVAVIILSLATPELLRAEENPYLTALRRAANRIVSYQQTDGAITMGGGTQVNPYFSSHAAIGLAHAYKVTKDKRYSLAIRNWLSWYTKHINEDGTIDNFDNASGQWQPYLNPKTSSYFDSTDAYAATFMEALSEAILIGGDAKWRKQMLKFVPKIFGAMRLTMQKKYGLTCATPNYPVMYTMDNIEVYRGGYSAAVISGLGTTDGKKRLGQANATLTAIQRLLREQSNVFYLIGIQTDGYQFTATKTMDNWYSEQMAQLMPIAWLPADSRHQTLYNEMKSQYFDSLPPNAGETDQSWQIREDNLGKLLFWTMATENIGDKTATTALLDRLIDFDSRMGAFYNVAFYGHLCRVFAYALK